MVLKTRWRGPVRYLLLGARTVGLLVRRRVRVLLVQNPSLILASLAVLLRALLGYRLIVDAHNEAVEPFINRQRWVKSLSRWVIRKADVTIVSNRQLAALVDAWGGRSFTLPDPIPVPPAGQRAAPPGRARSTWSSSPLTPLMNRWRRSSRPCATPTCTFT